MKTFIGIILFCLFGHAESYFGGGTGDFYLSALSLSRAEAQRLLPSDLIVDENLKQFPLFLSVANYSNLKGYAFGGHLTYPGFNYRELIVSLPFVKMRGSSKSFTYFKVLYLDSSLAVFNGVTFYGYPKKMGAFKNNGQSTGVTDSAGNRILRVLRSKVQNYDQATFQKNALFYFQSIRLPIVSKRLGRWVCSRLDWNMKSVQAEPVELSWNVNIPELKNRFDIRVPSLDKQEWGGIHFKGDWLLTHAYDCR